MSHMELKLDLHTQQKNIDKQNKLNIYFIKHTETIENTVDKKIV